MTESTVNLKETLNLPQTDFPIRAGLINKEPELLEKWGNENTYQKIKDAQLEFEKTFLLHDGPPYPNGNIHMGHALNKVLKDIVVRSKIMTGHKSPYIPGWDCHGLPIEVQVIKDLKSKGQEEKKQDIEWFRNRCKEFALEYVEDQKVEFQRLGIMGEWDKPYLTLHKEYEAKVVSSFGEIAENGIVFQGRKPIHWCTSCETALAEAEIEYKDHRSPSIFVRFEITEATPELASLLNNQKAHVLVWTTTPWTLSANVAIAAHADFTYVVGKTGDNIYLMVEELQNNLTELLEFSDFQILGKVSGKSLAGTKTQHPFIESRISPIVNADYVTKEDGTGFVHIAPGHGQDDYLVGQEYNLPMVMPVDGKGCFTDEVKWAGKNVFEANKDIGMHMEELGALLKIKFIKHSYPHCWRCKNPVIFRATKQWFIAMDTPMKNDEKTLRQKSLEAVKTTGWYPTWGEKRITSMIENRPDWCISRQRSWGIPIPAFICTKCDHPEMTGEFNKAATELMLKEGSTAWFSKSAKEILPATAKCSKCGNSEFELDKNILDVWFESGSSFESVLSTRPGLSWPADMYLEGSDQHRGWFQSSLLIGIGAKNTAPYKNVLTHGFIVDEKGHKMSKSVGNVISPQKVIKEYGADILRWWIASSDIKNDISLSKNILNQARDSFGKVRNTIRFCLSNLNDFDINKDAVAYENLEEIDRWALVRLQKLIQKVNDSYNNFEFHTITHTIHDFCTSTLSSLYLDMTKDRLYCDRNEGALRRSTQTVIYEIVDALIKLIAPIQVFTAEDAYSFFNKPNKKETVHLESLPTANKKYLDTKLDEKWDTLLEIKNLAYQQLEKLRNEKVVKSFLEAKVNLTLKEDIDFEDWASLMIVSHVDIQKGNELKVEVSTSDGEKCARCWKLLPLSDGLCERCCNAIK